MNTLTLYANEDGYKSFKSGKSFWVTDKQIFDTDYEISIDKDDNIQFVHHDDIYKCNVFNLKNTSTIKWINK